MPNLRQASSNGGAHAAAVLPSQPIAAFRLSAVTCMDGSNRVRPAVGSGRPRAHARGARRGSTRRAVGGQSAPGRRPTRAVERATKKPRTFRLRLYLRAILESAEIQSNRAVTVNPYAASL